MAKQKNDSLNFMQELGKLADSGIQADKAQLKKDMRAQFSNYREWIREYAVNAYDAKATWGKIFGEETDEEIIVTVVDNGKGMDKDRILKFFTLYTSEKDIDKTQAIGTHGIGKLSVAAIPNQTRFEMETSNGKEAWSASTGKLDGEEKIKINKLHKKIPKGTMFRIAFAKSTTLKREMELLKEVLMKYVRYVPLKVFISIPVSEKDPEFQTDYLISEDWFSPEENYYKDYKFEINRNEFHLRLSVDNGGHEVYQNRVCISDKYNLLYYGIDDSIIVNFLKIRLNGSSFELPFGRHCISNEHVLDSISRKIRNFYLPKFMESLYKDFEEYKLQECATTKNQVISLTCSMLAASRGDMFKAWNTFEFIRTADLGKISYMELKNRVKKDGKFYIQDEANSGIDYSNFEEVVLHHEQPDGLLSVLNKAFKDKCISLSQKDIVFEKPIKNENKLTPLQKEFENNLGFFSDLEDDETIDYFASEEESTEDYTNDALDTLPMVGSGLVEEVKDAYLDLKQMNWKVGFLVQKDFKTPSTTHLFKFSDNTITLNLYHPEIEKLVKLTEANPKLSGHWGTSLCLEDARNVIPNLNADTREDLLMLDGIARLENKTKKPSTKRKRYSDDFFIDFKRNMRDLLN